MTFAAMDFSPRRGVSDEHISGSVRSEQRSLGEKDLSPSGLRRIWPVASLLVGYSPLAGMRPPRASPNTKHQTPMKLQAPSSKRQRGSKFPARSAGRGLELGTWDLFGVWSLVFGVWSLFVSIGGSGRKHRAECRIQG